MLSAGFEALFIGHGLNPLDEGWPLYAAMQLHEGGTLYRDVFFVFPPGHLLCAWLGYWWDPPGVIATRCLYAGFNVALVLAVYLLGRRLMPPVAALLAATLLAVGAPASHGAHFLFGYRYFVFSVLALWCFAQRLRGGDARWMLASGALTGLALVFRLTPAFAAIGGIGAGVFVAHRNWSDRFGDGLRFGAGFALVVLPVAAWFAADVGWGTLWTEAVVRPIAMTDEQSLPVPPLGLPEFWTRWHIHLWFIDVQFRLFSLLFLVYGAVLAYRLLGAWRAGRDFESPLLMATAVWGAVYFTRAFGRADEAHLDSTLPAVCLLAAHAWSWLLGNYFAPPTEPADSELEAARRPGLEIWVAFAFTISSWMWLTNADRFVLLPSMRGVLPIESLDSRTAVTPDNRYRAIDGIVRTLRAHSDPEERVLDLTSSSLFHVVSGRRGPGWRDVVMPGTFESPEAELKFLERLRAEPPRLVIAPLWDFDDDPARAPAGMAPQLSAWIDANYRPLREVGDFEILDRIEAGKPSSR